MSIIQRVCSVHGDRRGPSKGAGHKDGGMSRDPFHLKNHGNLKTFCGYDASEWLVIDNAELESVLNHRDCCIRCRQGL